MLDLRKHSEAMTQSTARIYNDKYINFIHQPAAFSFYNIDLYFDPLQLLLSTFDPKTKLTERRNKSEQIRANKLDQQCIDCHNQLNAPVINPKTSSLLYESNYCTLNISNMEWSDSDTESDIFPGYEHSPSILL